MYERPYFSPFLPYPYQIRKALYDLKAHVWRSPFYNDWPAPTVLDMKRLRFYRWMYRTGKLTENL